MRAADTNVLVRLITRDNPAQADIAEDFVAEGVWAPVLGIAEAMWVLRAAYKRGPADLAATIEMLLKQRQLTIEHSDVVTSALELFRSTSSVGFSDCLMLELARKAGHLPLGTLIARWGVYQVPTSSSPYALET